MSWRINAVNTKLHKIKVVHSEDEKNELAMQLLEAGYAVSISKTDVNANEFAYGNRKIILPLNSNMELEEECEDEGPSIYKEI